MLRYCGCAVSLGNHHILCFQNFTEDFTETTAQLCLLGNLLSFLGLKFLLCTSVHPVWFLVGSHLLYFCCRNSFTQTLKTKIAELSNFPIWTEISLRLSNKQMLLFENTEVKITLMFVIGVLNKVDRGNRFSLNSCMWNSLVLWVHVTHFNSTSFSDRDLRGPIAMIGLTQCDAFWDVLRQIERLENYRRWLFLIFIRTWQSERCLDLELL